MTSLDNLSIYVQVSTHSRPKAAAGKKVAYDNTFDSFNTQPPEGGCQFENKIKGGELAVSTHSRPKAAACYMLAGSDHLPVSTHSRPKAAAHGKPSSSSRKRLFQHTAARRRLPLILLVFIPQYTEFQHTAARRRLHVCTKVSSIVS